MELAPAGTRAPECCPPARAAAQTTDRRSGRHLHNAAARLRIASPRAHRPRAGPWSTTRDGTSVHTRTSTDLRSTAECPTCMSGRRDNSADPARGFPIRRRDPETDRAAVPLGRRAVTEISAHLNRPSRWQRDDRDHAPRSLASRAAVAVAGTQCPLVPRSGIPEPRSSTTHTRTTVAPPTSCTTTGSPGRGCRRVCLHTMPAQIRSCPGHAKRAARGKGGHRCRKDGSRCPSTPPAA